MGNPVPTHERSDLEHLTAAKLGDAAAFATLVDHHAHRVYRLVYLIVQNHHDTEDVVQEAFASAFHRLPALRQDDSFGAWLARIAVNRARDLVRKQQAQRRRDDTYVKSLPPEPEAPNTERSELLKEAIASLPHQHREVVLLYYSGELTAQEVGNLLGRPSGTIRRLLSEAYGFLRKQMGGNTDA